MTNSRAIPPIYFMGEQSEIILARELAREAAAMIKLSRPSFAFEDGAIVSSEYRTTTYFGAISINDGQELAITAELSPDLRNRMAELIAGPSPDRPINALRILDRTPLSRQACFPAEAGKRTRRVRDLIARAGLQRPSRTNDAATDAFAVTAQAAAYAAVRNPGANGRVSLTVPFDDQPASISWPGNVSHDQFGQWASTKLNPVMLVGTLREAQMLTIVIKPFQVTMDVPENALDIMRAVATLPPELLA